MSTETYTAVQLSNNRGPTRGAGFSTIQRKQFQHEAHHNNADTAASSRWDDVMYGPCVESLHTGSGGENVLGTGLDASTLNK